MDERQIAELVAKIKAALGTNVSDVERSVKEFASRLLSVEQQVAGRGGPAIGPIGGADPLLSDAVKSRLNALSDGQLNTGKIPLAGLRLSRVKALISGSPGDSPPVTYPTQAQRGPDVPPARRPLQLLDLLLTIPVMSNSYEFTQIIRTQAAGAQVEGAAKPETTFETELKTATVATIATHATASRQVLADNVQLLDTVRGVLATDALEVFEHMLLNGDGTAGSFLGLIPQATSIVATATKPADKLSEAIASMWAAGFVTGAVVLNPGDWHEMRSERATGGNEQYVAGGWANPAPPTIWGVPLVQTPSIQPGSSLLVDLSRVRLLDREQVSVMISTEHGDNFTKNLVTILAELRGSVAVLDTGGVGLVEFGT